MRERGRDRDREREIARGCSCTRREAFRSISFVLVTAWVEYSKTQCSSPYKQGSVSEIEPCSFLERKSVAWKGYRVCECNLTFEPDGRFLRNLGLVSKPVILISYVVGLRAGRPRNRSSIPGGVSDFFFTKTSRPALERTQPLLSLS
jgi:hypothetical protein